jgi:hypothetical protein
MTIGIFAGLILICCLVGWFIGIPRFQDSISDSLSEEVGTQIAAQFPSTQLSAGSEEIDVAMLESALAGNLDGASLDNVTLDVDENGRMELGFTSGEQDLTYTGQVTAENGELKIEDMDVNQGFFGWFLPADKLGNAIEDGVNNYFSAQGLEIESIDTSTPDKIKVELVDKS